jgi:predicted ATPase with chaperone activity
MERLQISRYVGPAPVSLEEYDQRVRAQARSQRTINAPALERAYEDLTLEPALLRQLGPAIISRTSMLLYGPSGTGKSALAERMLRIFDDTIAVPYAVEAYGSIVSVFDPAIHRPVGDGFNEADPRWVLCIRPCVIVGGELVPAMLELQKDSDTGTYSAPLHMKANNGIFVVDDFGRQMISPRDLLNRWIVPLDRRVDYLSMGGSRQFPIPFEMLVVFSTNLKPSELADEAFLRRIPNKILVNSVSEPVFDAIAQRVLDSRGWSADPGALRHLRRVCQGLGGDLRPCYPRDIFRIVQATAEYAEAVPHLSVGLIDQAAEVYFTTH